MSQRFKDMGIFVGSASVFSIDEITVKVDSAEAVLPGLFMKLHSSRPPQDSESITYKKLFAALVTQAEQLSTGSLSLAFGGSFVNGDDMAVSLAEPSYEKTIQATRTAC